MSGTRTVSAVAWRGAVVCVGTNQVWTGRVFEELASLPVVKIAPCCALLLRRRFAQDMCVLCVRVCVCVCMCVCDCKERGREREKAGPPAGALFVLF